MPSSGSHCSTCQGKCARTHMLHGRHVSRHLDDKTKRACYVCAFRFHMLMCTFACAHVCEHVWIGLCVFFVNTNMFQRVCVHTGHMEVREGAYTYQHPCRYKGACTYILVEWMVCKSVCNRTELLPCTTLNAQPCRLAFSTRMKRCRADT